MKSLISPILYAQACNELYNNANGFKVTCQLIGPHVSDSINIIMVRFPKNATYLLQTGKPGSREKEIQ